MPVGVVDMGEPTLLPLPDIYKTFGKEGRIRLSSALRIDCRQQVSAWSSVLVGKGRVKRFPFPRWEARPDRVRWSEQAFCNLRTLPGVPALIVKALFVIAADCQSGRSFNA